MLSLIKYHTDRKSKGCTFEISRFKSFAACKSVKSIFFCHIPFLIRVSENGKTKPVYIKLKEIYFDWSHLEKNIKKKHNLNYKNIR